MTERNLEDSVDFTYNGSKYSVQSHLSDTISIICQKFIIKANLSENSVYFLLSGKQIDENIKKRNFRRVKNKGKNR